MIYNEREERHNHILEVGRQMMTAARTAPKGKGVDIIEIAMVSGDELNTLAAKMVEMAEESGMKFLLRDAGNMLEAECVLLVGTRQLIHALNCGHCGFATCGEKPAATPCVINSIDVGIAIGSACATAADLRVDSRVMFSAGWAAERLGWLGEGVHQTMAIAVSASSKSPFFDRKPKQ
ncbi:MAG: DUF2148 domain-containing protein [Rikenellaceae bacterium]